MLVLPRIFPGRILPIGGKKTLDRTKKCHQKATQKCTHYSHLLPKPQKNYEHFKRIDFNS